MKAVKSYSAVLLAMIAMFVGCRKMETFTNPPYVDQPRANAGADQVISIPNDTIVLDGTKSYGSGLLFNWQTLSGPNSPLISDPTAKKTVVRNLIAGVYQFELKVTNDRSLVAKDTVSVTVSIYPPDCNAIPLKVTSGPGTIIPFGNFQGPRFSKPVTAADKIVFLSDRSSTNEVDIYNLSTNTWSVANVSERRTANTTTTVVGNKILFTGGSGYPYTLVDIYDASTNTWSTGSLSTQLWGSEGIVVSNNKVFFAGGFRNPNYEISSRIDIYDATTNTWSTAELSQPRVSVSAVAYGNKVFFAGGSRNYDSNDYIQTDQTTLVDVLDLSNNTWSVTNLSQARAGAAARAAGNKIIFAGGFTGQSIPAPAFNVSGRIDILDMSTNTWSTAALSEARTDLATTVVNNKVFLAGGTPFVGGYSNKVDIYDAISNTWTTSILSERRIVSSIATLGTKMLFFTSQERYATRVTKLVDIYDMSTNTWAASELNYPISSYAITAGNQVFIPGGVFKLATTCSSCVLSATCVIWKFEF